MKKTVKKIVSLLLVLIISIGTSIVAFAAETAEKGYEFNEETGELRLYNDKWDEELTADLNVDDNDVIESCTISLPRAEYEFLLKVKSIFIGKDVSYNSDEFSDLFLCTANLEKISADADNENVTGFDNVLYSKDKKTLLKCPIAREDKNVTIAEECTEFEKFAFSSLDLKKDSYITVEGDNEHPNYRQKRINLIFTKEGQFKELAWDCVGGRRHYIDNIYVPESQNIIDVDKYNSFASIKTVSWISTTYYCALADESLQEQYMIAISNKQSELNEKYNSGDTTVDYLKQYGDLLVFLIEEGYADNLEDNIFKYGLYIGENEDEEVLQNCARICSENINTAINNKECVKNLSSFIKDSEVVNGKCGENVYYSFTQNDGLLKISGSGTMYSSDTFDATNFTNENSEKLVGLSVNTAKFDEFNVKKLTIESGVTSISDAAFLGCNNLTSVCIASENATIGKDTFPRNENLQIIAPKDSSVYAALNGENYNAIPYSYTVNKDDKNKPMLALGSKVVLTEDMWICICSLVKDTDVQYIYFEELDISKMLSSDILEGVDKSSLKSEKVTLSIIRDGETIRLDDVEEKTTFQKIVEAVTGFFTFILNSVISGFKGMWASIKNWWK